MGRIVALITTVICRRILGRLCGHPRLGSRQALLGGLQLGFSGGNFVCRAAQGFVRSHKGPLSIFASPSAFLERHGSARQGRLADSVTIPLRMSSILKGRTPAAHIAPAVAPRLCRTRRIHRTRRRVSPHTRVPFHAFARAPAPQRGGGVQVLHAALQIHPITRALAPRPAPHRHPRTCAPTAPAVTCRRDAMSGRASS